MWRQDVEIYEFVCPTYNVSLNSAMYSTVPSPLSNIIVDYKALREAVLRRNYADAWNTQAKLICSYTSQRNAYHVSEGNPITAPNDWDYPQNRLGITTDSNLPSDMEQNAFVRDHLFETMLQGKPVDHKPVVYTLPKNTKIESMGALQSIQVPPLALFLLRRVGMFC